MFRLFFLFLFSLPSLLPASVTETYATNVDGSGTNLKWDRYTPSTGGPTWPSVLVVHGGGFRSNNRGPSNISQDLADAGFLTFAIDYRLAPPHTEMPYQFDPPSDGRPPQQTADVQRAIRAARADSHCNGKVAIVGVSAGGSHAAWWVISGTANDDMPDAIVCCSGPFDLDNSDFLSNPSNVAPAQNYVNHIVSEGEPYHTAAKAASPQWLTVGATPKPILIFNSTAEQSPVSVANNFSTKLTNAGATVELHIRTGTEHASSYWYLSYGGAFSTVKDCTIDFLNRMLGSSQTPSAPAKIVIKIK